MENVETRKTHVLLIENNDKRADVILAELRHAGFDPSCQRVGGKADFLAHLHSGIDVILSDYTMPGFDAPTALRLLHESGFDIPFIVVSWRAGEETAPVGVGQSTDLLQQRKDRLARLGPAIARALENKHLRRERKRSDAAAQASEEKFNELAEHIHEVFWTRDPESNEVLYVSPSYEEIWGRSCESAYGSAGSWRETIHPDDRERIYQAIDTKQSRGEYDEEYRILRPDGSVRWVHDQAFPVRDATGKVDRIVGTTEDITKRRDLEDQLRQVQKMESIGHLASGVVHDFNNLLTVIRGYALMLLTEDQSKPEMTGGLSEILAAAERATTLTRQLLMFSGKQPVQLKVLDLNRVVADVAKMLQRIIGEDISLHLNCQPGLPPVWADAGMIEQVLVNLSVNARDAMPEGGQLTVNTSLTSVVDGDLNGHPKGRLGEFVTMEISDTGSGIALEVLAHIFEPFFTTKLPGHGTGLGLATVLSIVEQHGGWLDVKSEPSQGTTFKVFIPRAYVQLETTQTKTVARESKGGTETILCVEDDHIIGQLVAAILERRSYTVLSAGSGLQALAIWKEHAEEIALVITDIVMPDGLTGGQLVEILREQKPNLKVIFASGYFADSKPGGMDFEEGVNYLQKPFTPGQLTDMVRKCLDS